ncbi:MAG: hypothetical protein V3U02_06645 [Calditrichia bacterium]
MASGWHGESRRHSEVRKNNSTQKIIDLRKSEISKLDAKISDIYKQATIVALHAIEVGGTMEDSDKAHKAYIKKAKLDQLIKKRDNLRRRVWKMEEGIRISNIPKKERYSYKGRVIKKGEKPYIHTLDIIRELEKEYNAPVLRREIIERGKSEGLSGKQVDEAIHRLRMDAQIYDPRRNQEYKIV